MNSLALTTQIAVTLLTLCGIVYGVIALLAARDFERTARAAKLRAATAIDAEAASGAAFGVTVLKPVKGVDARMHAGLASHCTQQYAGEYELLFGVSSLDDPAVAEIARLRVEYPAVNIRLVECTKRLGANGKLSNLAQMLPHARFEHVIVNDSDIRVAPRYLSRVMAPFAEDAVPQPEKQIPFLPQQANAPRPGYGNDDKKGGVALVGLVTVPYIGRAESTIWSRMEALGIATEFMPGVLTARKLEGGIRFGLGSTLATTKSALAAIGGFEALVDQLADDYELGARLSAAGYRVELVDELVETTVPAYTLRGFCDHQLRWTRSTRDSRRAGYLGMGVTYVLPWAIATVIASGGVLWSWSLLSAALLVRVSVALTVGVGILGDGQVLRDIVLLPLRDCCGLFFWVWSYASDEVVWRGERFRLRRGTLERL